MLDVDEQRLTVRCLGNTGDLAFLRSDEEMPQSFLSQVIVELLL
jgi:hypothetical protein